MLRDHPRGVRPPARALLGRARSRGARTLRGLIGAGASPRTGKPRRPKVVPARRTVDCPRSSFAPFVRHPGGSYPLVWGTERTDPEAIREQPQCETTKIGSSLPLPRMSGKPSYPTFFRDPNRRRARPLCRVRNALATGSGHGANGGPRPPRPPERARHGGPQRPAQSSISSPGTRENSRALLVTSVTSRLKACAAIRVSSGPIGVPALSSAALTRP